MRHKQYHDINQTKRWKKIKKSKNKDNTDNGLIYDKKLPYPPPSSIESPLNCSSDGCKA